MAGNNINSLLDLIGSSLYPGMQGGSPRRLAQPTGATAQQPPPQQAGAPAALGNFFMGQMPAEAGSGPYNIPTAGGIMVNSEGLPERPNLPPAFEGGMPTAAFAAANMAMPGRGWSPLNYMSGNFDPDAAAAASPGFFRLSDYYGRGGARTEPVEGPRGPGQPTTQTIPGSVPQMFSAGAGDLSTDNWRLLGMGPGYVMRNGQIVKAGGVDRGFWAGGNPMGGVSAEHGNIVPFIGAGTGAAYGYPNLFAPGYAPPKVGWPGSIRGWTPIFAGAGD